MFIRGDVSINITKQPEQQKPRRNIQCLNAGKKTDREKDKEEKEEGGVITVALVGSS